MTRPTTGNNSGQQELSLLAVGSTEWYHPLEGSFLQTKHCLARTPNNCTHKYLPECSENLCSNKKTADMCLRQVHSQLPKTESAQKVH